jgi:hypothetical protein
MFESKANCLCAKKGREKNLPRDIPDMFSTKTHGSRST